MTPVLLPVFLAVTLLQQAADTRPPHDGALHLAGHAYRLSCTFEGESAPCAAKGGVSVDHFEIRDETGRVQFEKDAPPDKPFSYVGMWGTGSGTRWILEVDVTAEDSEPPVSYIFDPAHSRLVPFNPPVTCASGRFSTVSVAGGGTGLGCALGNHYFTLLVILTYDYDHHRIELTPQRENGYFAEPVMELGSERAGRLLFNYPDEIPAPKAPAPAELELYSQHDDHAPYAKVQVSEGETIKLLGGWSPVSMTPVEKTSAKHWGVGFDPTSVWLYVEVSGRKGWIRGEGSFRAIGLPVHTN